MTLPRKAFQIPKVEEVTQFLKVKKGWPSKFCEYYAERFWNHYQSNGWRISGRAAMKDWKAAVISQWLVLKFKEDLDYLNTCMKTGEGLKEAKLNGTDPNVAYLDEVLNDYRKNYLSVPEERLASCYDTLKQRKWMRLSSEQKQLAVETSHGDVQKGKAICVKYLFENMINHGYSFAAIQKNVV